MNTQDRNPEASDEKELMGLIGNQNLPVVALSEQLVKWRREQELAEVQMQQAKLIQQEALEAYAAGRLKRAVARRNIAMLKNRMSEALDRLVTEERT
jgi:hypothetical protein